MVDYSCAHCKKIFDNEKSLVIYDKSKGVMLCNGPSGNEQIHYQVWEMKKFSCHWQYMVRGNSINVMQGSLSVAIKECDSYRQKQNVIQAKEREAVAKQAGLYQRSMVNTTTVEPSSNDKSLVQRVLEMFGW